MISEDREVELTEALGIGDRIDLHDLPALDREAKHHHELSTRSDDDSDGSQERAVTDLVEQPAKVMRIGSMIRQLLEEVKAAPLDVSNVMVICPTCKQPTRVGTHLRTVKDKTIRVRVCRNADCGQEIDK